MSPEEDREASNGGTNADLFTRLAGRAELKPLWFSGFQICSRLV
jgi:hypothetical protein